jgi:hypothetical protein
MTIEVDSAPTMDPAPEGPLPNVSLMTEVAPAPVLALWKTVLSHLGLGWLLRQV